MPRSVARFEGTKQELLANHDMTASGIDLDGYFMYDPDEQDEFIQARDAYRAAKVRWNR
jgi:hypothetical protein